MKKAVVIVSVLTAMAFAAGCAASPDDVCAHMAKLMAKEKTSEADKAKSEEMMKVFKTACVSEVKKRKEKIGYFKYRKQSRCIMDADTMAEATKCK